MGALSEMYDKECSRTAYRIADAISRGEIDWFYGDPAEISQEEIKEYLEAQGTPFMVRNAGLLSSMILGKLRQFIGESEPDSYFFLSEWHFKNHKDVSSQIAFRCQKYGLEYTWRKSTDNDFFMFRPLEHGIGLEIKNTPNYPPYRLNEIFNGLETDQGRIEFGW